MKGFLFEQGRNPSSMPQWRESLAEIEPSGSTEGCWQRPCGRTDVALITRPVGPLTLLHHETYWQWI